MDLAWVLLIWIRSLFLFLCSPVLWFFLIVFLLAILYMFFCATLFFCIVLFSFFLCVSFFLRGDEDVAIWRGVHVIG